MKVFKSIMLYLLILLGLVTAALLVCCVIMICSPNTSIFGYKYVSYKDVLEDEVSISSGEYSGINAVSITSNRMDIKIIPNTKNQNVRIVYSQGMSGFVKKDAVDLQVNISKNDAKEFESGDVSTSGATYKTLCIDVSEPEGVIFLSDCYIKVYLPAGKTYSVINAYSKNGGIDYTSNTENKTIGVTNLYLKSTSRDVSKKSINIYKPNATRYYVRTGVGYCYFINDEADISGNIIFETSGGKLLAKNGALKGHLTVRSSADVNGATLDITKLYGSLTFVAKSGNISIGTIEKGTNGSSPSVDIQSKYCNIKIDTLKGTITTQGYEGSDVDNIDVTINNLYYINGLEGIDIDSSKGNIVINRLSGDANLESSTGNITVKEANCTTLYVNTYNGYINVDFVNSELKLTNFDVHVAKRSNMNLNNLRGNVNITVDGGDSRNINLSFYAKVIDNAEKCTVNITTDGDNVNLKDISSGKFAVYADGDIDYSDVVQTSIIENGDGDYDKSYVMPNQRRFNYDRPSSTVSYSKIFVHNRNNVRVYQ